MLTKLLAGAGLGLEVLIFAMLPYYYSKILSSNKITNIFNNFSAGLFLGIAFLHIIPQANQSFDTWLGRNAVHIDLTHDHSHHHEHTHLVPIGSLVSLVTFLIVLTIEVYFNDGHCASEREHAHQERKYNHQMREVLVNEKVKMRRRLMLETYLTQLALSIHSFFECMSIGIETSEKVTMTLAGAILFHKWAQALTLGFSYSVSGMSRDTALKFAIFHSCLNAGAVLFGYYLSQTSELLKGLTSGISGGTFIYICMVQKINKNFSDNHELFTKLALVLAGLGFSILILS